MNLTRDRITYARRCYKNAMAVSQWQQCDPSKGSDKVPKKAFAKRAT